MTAALAPLRAGARRADAASRSGALALGAVAFAAAIVLLPWEAIRGSPFPDIANYLARIEALRAYGPDYFDRGTGWLDRLSGEALWFALLKAIAALPVDPRTALYGVSAVASALTYLYLARLTGPVLAFVLLLNPVTIDLLSSQLRSALAMSLVLLAALSVRRAALMAAAAAGAAFLHVAMLAVGGLALAAMVSVRLRLAHAELAALCVLGGAGAGIVIALGGPMLLEAVGDRRAGVDFGGKSLLYVAFWGLFGLYLALRCATTVRQPDWALAFAIVLCVAVPVMEALGFAGFRFLALGYPVVVAAGLRLGREGGAWSLLALLLYEALLFIYWVRP